MILRLSLIALAAGLIAAGGTPSATLQIAMSQSGGEQPAPPTPPAPSKPSRPSDGSLPAGKMAPSESKGRHEPSTSGSLVGDGVAPSTPPAVPKKSGASRTSITGCLMAKSEAEARRFPAAAQTRSGPPMVVIKPAPGGAQVIHQLAHACCLKGEVSTRLDRGTAVVTEKLSGSPCRCQCQSKLQTSIRLPAGEWTVAVEVDLNGHADRVAEKAIDVAKD